MIISASSWQLIYSCYCSLLLLCVSCTDIHIVQDRQYTCVGTSRRVRVSVVVVENQYVLHILTVSVASVIQNAKRIRHIVICSLSDWTLFFQVISQTARFSGEKNKTLNINLCFDLIYKFFLKIFSF